jgi:replicative DNA helicase
MIMTRESDLSEFTQSLDNAFKGRELIRLSNEIPKSLEKLDSNTVISKVGKRLDKLTQASGGQDVILLGDILDSTLDTISERRANPGLQGITTGFPKVDAVTTGYGKGELWYIGARPSVGKTAILLKSLLEVSKTGVATLLINREMNLININERLYSMVSRVPFLNIRSGNLTDREMKALSEAKEELRELPFFIDNNWLGNEIYVLSTIRKYHHTHGVRIVGLDYIQLMVARSSESVHELGSLSRSMKLLSGELEITSIILSQLNRDVEGKPDHRPEMHHLRQSGNLEEDGDYMVGLYRDDIYNTNSPVEGTMEYNILKGRNAPRGTYILRYDAPTVTVYDESSPPDNKWMV